MLPHFKSINESFDLLTTLSPQEPEDAANAQSAIDNILLRNEFELNRDIRDYLRKWQVQNVNDLDPIRGPGTVNPDTLSSGEWVGNMLNDSGSTIEESMERAESLAQDTSDIQFDMDGHDEVGDILEPGDLVGFYS
jgi:hypothetical protein